MDMMFLGGGAAEGIPAAFCRCEYCMKVRQNGGKDIRVRSTFRIDARQLHMYIQPCPYSNTIVL
jgi:phosphoribosyl 1,2-cyclic phosphate phosphodiesterase